MLNNINLLGRLTADPELRKTQSGVSVANFTLAVDRDFADNAGNRETDFVSCVAWRGTADFVCKYFSKGQLAAVNGRLQSRKWTDKDDNSRTAWEVIANSVYFGGNKKSNEQSDTYAPPEFDNVDEDDGELPF